MYEGLQEEIDACRKVKLVHQRRLILKKKDLEPIPKYVGEDLNDITATQPPQSHKSTREESLYSHHFHYFIHSRTSFLQHFNHKKVLSSSSIQYLHIAAAEAAAFSLQFSPKVQEAQKNAP